MGVHLEARICSLEYPLDLDREADIIRLGHEFFGLIPIDQVYVKAQDLVGTRQYEIGTKMDSILNRAITERGFEMYYQPIYNIREKRFYSAEALARLNDKQYGIIPPALFIPAAESKGLILPIGDFVLESVFSFISSNDISTVGLDYIEINLSVAQCLQPDLPDKVKQLQEKYNIDPTQVNFEITETTYDTIGNVAEKNIRKLVEMGYSFSLDDYGTGYSNMKRVVTLPLKIIKLDKSLIDEMKTSTGCSVVKSVIQMMKDIHKELVAEGVETKEDLDLLQEAGCDFIQGFYFSKPLPASGFLSFLNDHLPAKST